MPTFVVLVQFRLQHTSLFSFLSWPIPALCIQCCIRVPTTYFVLEFSLKGCSSHLHYPYFNFAIVSGNPKKILLSITYLRYLIIYILDVLFINLWSVTFYNFISHIINDSVDIIHTSAERFINEKVWNPSCNKINP